MDPSYPKWKLKWRHFCLLGSILSFYCWCQISELFQIDLNILQRDDFHGLIWLTGQRPCTCDNETVTGNVKVANVHIIQAGEEPETDYVKTLRRGAFNCHCCWVATPIWIGQSRFWGLSWGGGGWETDREIGQEELLKVTTLWVPSTALEHLGKDCYPFLPSVIEFWSEVWEKERPKKYFERKLEPDSEGVSSVPSTCWVVSFQRRSLESGKLAEAKGPDLTCRNRWIWGFEDIRIIRG